MSSVGMWFGISVLSLNPFPLLNKWLPGNTTKEPIHVRYTLLRLALKRNQNETGRMRSKFRYKINEMKQDIVKLRKDQVRLARVEHTLSVITNNLKKK